MVVDRYSTISSIFIFIDIILFFLSPEIVYKKKLPFYKTNHVHCAHLY